VGFDNFCNTQIYRGRVGYISIMGCDFGNPSRSSDQHLSRLHSGWGVKVPLYVRRFLLKPLNDELGLVVCFFLWDRVLVRACQLGVDVRTYYSDPQ
jgi:hypothetical protein